MEYNTNDEYLIESFTLTDSEASRLADLIQHAFQNMDSALKHGGTIQFDEETFKFMFCSPYNPYKDLFIRAIYKPTGETVGFMGSIPRKVKVKDKIYNCFIPSWQAVHWNHKRKGIAREIVIKMIEEGKKRNVDAAFALFEPEEHGINSAKSATQKINFPMVNIYKTNKFIIRVLDIKRTAGVIKLKWFEKLFLGAIQGVQKINNPNIRDYRKEDAEQIYDLMLDLNKRNDVAILHEKNDFEWYLNQPGINCVVHTDNAGKINGLMLAWKFHLSGFGNSTTFGWLDIIHLYKLTTKEAADLSKYLIRRSFERGWAGIQSPYIPYYNPEPLKKSRFVFFPKKLILSFFLNTNITFPEKLDSLFFDWR
jgi:hypothetical protein